VSWAATTNHLRPIIHGDQSLVTYSIASFPVRVGGSARPGNVAVPSTINAHNFLAIVTH